MLNITEYFGYYRPTDGKKTKFESSSLMSNAVIDSNNKLMYSGENIDASNQEVHNKNKINPSKLLPEHFTNKKINLFFTILLLIILLLIIFLLIIFFYFIKKSWY
jgi:ATP-dependent Zn protease